MSMMKNLKEKTTAFYAKSRFEILRIVTIARHMFTASQVNAELSKCYNDLGRIVAEALQSKELDWGNHHAQNLLVNIKDLSQKLELMEKEVNQAKFAPFGTFFKKE